MSVDNFVDKPPLTAREARFYAGFNKMLNRQAIIYTFKINDLQITVNRLKNITEKISSDIFLALSVHKLCFAQDWQIFKLLPNYKENICELHRVM